MGLGSSRAADTASATAPRPDAIASPTSGASASTASSGTPSSAGSAAAPPSPSGAALTTGSGKARPFVFGPNEEICLLLSHALPGLFEGDLDKPRHATEGNIERAMRSALGPVADDAAYSTFVRLCEREAKQWNASALNNLAWAKLYGLGDGKAERDEVSAVGYFDAAVQRGSVIAENNLLICQIRGVGTGDGAGSITVNGTDVVTASLFKQVRSRCCTVPFWGGSSSHLAPQFVFAGLTVLAEQKQCPGAQYNLGCAHYLGVGTKPDVSRAVQYFARSANAGFLPAMYALAKCLADGKGVTANPLQAQELMRKVSAEQNPPRVTPKSAISSLIASGADAERAREQLDAKHRADSLVAAADGKTAAPPVPEPSPREKLWLADAKESTAITWRLALSHDGWTREGGDVAEGVEVYTRQFTTTMKEYAANASPYYFTTSQKTYKIYRCHALVAATVKQLFDLLREENVQSWNPAVDASKVLQQLDADTDITYTLAAPSVGGAVSPRDFVNTRRSESREFIGCAEPGMNTTNSGTVHDAALPNKSVDGATAPTAPGVAPPTPGSPTTAIRGYNGPGAYVVLPVPGHDASKDGPLCHVVWIMNADLKGWLPTWLVESTLCSVMNRWVKTVRTVVEQRYKTTLRQSPELMPSPSGMLDTLKSKVADPEAA